MKTFLLLGSVNAFLAVALGAFGAHGLKARVSAEMLEVWRTGVQYHMAHALAMILVGVLVQLLPQSALLRSAGWSMLIGIVLFSGSLYILSFSGVRTLGMITPFGGIAFLIGWVLLAFAALRV